MAELVDAPASGAGVCMDVEVRVLFWAPLKSRSALIYNNKINFLVFVSPNYPLKVI
jgi:hypothetical protein